MESSKFSIKFFVQDPSKIGEITDLVPLFHSWIQTHALADHLLIDVADYAHVHNGPGIVLVSHEANYSFDSNKGRPGLTYQRKQPLSGSFSDRVRATLRYTLEAAALLEQSLDGRIKFRTDEVQFRIHDRLLAPSEPQTFEAVKRDLQKVFADAFGGEVKLEYRPSNLELFEVTIRPTKAPAIEKLIDRITAATPS
jgi:hypothetical protein